MRDDGTFYPRPNHSPDSRLAIARSSNSGETVVGHTIGMKTAVVIPDDVFNRAECLVKRAKKSRSQVYSDALREYVARHAPEEITEAMNRVIDNVMPEPDPFITESARRILLQTEW